MMYSLDFTVVVDRMSELLWGAAGTVMLSVAGMALALVIGVLGVITRQSKSLLLSVPTRVFVEVIRNTPFLVQVFFLFFALPYLGVRLNPTITAIIALAINGGAYAIEIIRGGVEAIPKGQREAGYALGLSGAQTFRYIVLKPAVRAIYPALAAQAILLTLTSSVCSSIAAFELTSVAGRIEAESFRSFEVYFTITFIYLLIAWTIMVLLKFLGKQFLDYPAR
ncbi:amino acid ABC transporter permease [Martelella soudanensis]|uniref:amino acid ABC transporter permease n=1 Tax=unclassified Martelella TaxID=2629616 RepID=UPI0015DFA706|nr:MULTISPECIES: amino acid ABC transporter permease [unclassified Martelella]